MWNPIRDWVALSSIHKHPTEDAADGPGNTLPVGADDEDCHRCEETADVCDPGMTDPLKIQQDYTMGRRLLQHETKNLSVNK